MEMEQRVLDREEKEELEQAGQRLWNALPDYIFRLSTVLPDGVCHLSGPQTHGVYSSLGRAKEAREAQNTPDSWMIICMTREQTVGRSETDTILLLAVNLDK